MSVYYSIRSVLSTEVNATKIKEILKNGQKLGCIYYTEGSLPQQKNITQLSIDEAVVNLMHNLDDKEELPCVLAQLDDTLFNVFFTRSDQNDLVVTLSFLANIWKVKTKEGYSFVDFARYIKIFMPMIEGFVVKNFETIAE